MGVDSHTHRQPRKEPTAGMTITVLVYVKGEMQFPDASVPASRYTLISRDRKVWMV
jgi:hypothetical protein